MEMTEKLYQKCGDKIRDKRKSIGQSQVDFANDVGVSDKAVSNWERGKDLDSLIRYANLEKVTGVTLYEMVYDDKMIPFTKEQINYVTDIVEEISRRQQIQNVSDIIEEISRRRQIQNVSDIVEEMLRQREVQNVSDIVEEISRRREIQTVADIVEEMLRRRE